MNSTPDPAHLQVNYTQSMDHITNYTPQASSLHVNYLMTYMVDHITSAPKSGSRRLIVPVICCYISGLLYSTTPTSYYIPTTWLHFYHVITFLTRDPRPRLLYSAVWRFTLPANLYTPLGSHWPAQDLHIRNQSEMAAGLRGESHVSELVLNSIS